MRKILGYLLVVLATLSVSLLGYYGYTIASSRLSYAMQDVEHQYGTTMNIMVDFPWIHRVSETDSTSTLIDQDALSRSLERGGKPWQSTISGEVGITIGRASATVSINPLPTGESVMLNADTYNSLQQTGWELPKNITLTSSEVPRGIEITPIGLPRELRFEATTYGYPGLDTSHINWYLVPIGEGIWDCSVHGVWDPSTAERITPQTITTYTVGQKQVGTYVLPLDHYPENSCLIAGLQGDNSGYRYGSLPPATVTGSLIDELSPEYNMQSRIEFDFGADIYTDTGALYSEDYIDNRSRAKIEFLKHLSISGDLQITPDMLELSLRRAILTLHLQEGSEYHVALSDVEDIYGRTLSTSLDIRPTSKPLVSLQLNGGKGIWRYGDPIGMKLYHVKTPKKEYEIQLCRMTLEGFSRLERMSSLTGRSYESLAYDTMSGAESSHCITKTIVLNPTGYMTEFRVSDFASGGLSPGLYAIGLKHPTDILGERLTFPRTFSVIDSHIVMKVDPSGKFNFLVTDIRTGLPREGQKITLKNNIGKTYDQTWNEKTQSYERNYIPMTNQVFATGITLGSTRPNGILDSSGVTTNDFYPYGLTYEYLDFEGRYSSYVALAEGGGHLGYVVSTWNDGVTGWNFGMKDSDYSWDTRSQYTAYTHTERRLYLPGDTVHIKSIIRENNTILSIPEGKVFDITVTDPRGKMIMTKRIKANAWGSIATDIEIDKNSPLGSYQIQILPVDRPEYIENGYTNFQVEIFKNPTFTTEVKLSSPEIENETLTHVKKIKNDNPNTPWYEYAYTAPMHIEGLIRAHYYNGADLKNTSFSYRIYRSPHYDDAYWGDCFWGCYYEPPQEFFSEGTGSIGSDGYGIFRANVDFVSYQMDYDYSVEVTITDPLSGEVVTTPATLLVRLDNEYKGIDIENPLQSKLSKKLLNQGDALNVEFSPLHGKWTDTMNGRYAYSIIHREYASGSLQSDSGVPTFVDTEYLSGTISSKTLMIDTKTLSSGEYSLIIYGVTQDHKKIQSASESTFFIQGSSSLPSKRVSVTLDKTVYHVGDQAHIIIHTPFSSGGHLYLTRERGGVLNHEYITLTGSTYMTDLVIDESYYPNLYIGAIASPAPTQTGGLTYAVGYGEIVMDLTDKKSYLKIQTNKDIYTTRESVTLDLTLTDKNNEGQLGEIEVMVIDESLIRLIGNIDLDIIPKFFRKYPFTIKTALTAIGIERNKFLSRLGSNGGSGAKGGDGVQISSRTLFKNTAYYNASILTKKDGRAQVKFTLPDNVTEYRIIAIGQTRSTQIAVSEKTISVKKDYTIESHVPTIAYGGDSTTIIASVFNSTRRVTPLTLTLEMGTGASMIRQTTDIILNPSESVGHTFDIKIPNDWKGTTSYRLTANEGKNTLDSVEKTIRILTPPEITDPIRLTGTVTGTGKTISVPARGSNTSADSPVTLSLSTSPLQNPERIIASLLSYPYGCIEQTISSTLPNALALRLAGQMNLQIDTKQAEENLKIGVAKILRMQDPTYGGWKYWETDTMPNEHVTPYVIRSLLEFRSLGVTIPDEVITTGLNSLMGVTDNPADPDMGAEIFATFALARDPRAEDRLTMINPQKLSRHGYLMYSVGLDALGKLDAPHLQALKTRMSSKKDESSYWYWNDDADAGIYARLLISRGDLNQATDILVERLRYVNLESYYVSTQAKIQLFLALSALHQKKQGSLSDVFIRSNALKIVVNTPKASRYSTTTRRSLIGTELSVSMTGSSQLYYDILLSDTPIDIYSVPAKSVGGIQVSRVFERVDTSRGLDRQGQFLSVTPVTDGVFKKGELYRVRLSVKTPNQSTNKYYLTLEDYLPGGWRPIQGKFDTESKSTTDASSEYGYWNGWTHVESTEDRVLATQEYLWQTDKPYTYMYYIRPEYTGEYLLPPATAYYMYEPEIHSLTRYERIRVIE